MTKELREWMSAKEIAALKISGFPQTTSGVHYYAKANGINLNKQLCRPRKKAGGGVEYHKSIILPALDDPLNWITAQEIIDMNLSGLPRDIDSLQAKFRRDGVEENPMLFRRHGMGHAFLYHRTVITEFLSNVDHLAWFSAQEIADMNLPGFPADRSSISRYLRNTLLRKYPKLCRHRIGSGGGYEYHIDALPEVAKTRCKTITRSKRKPTVRPRIRLERRPLGRLIETFPTATEIRVDLTRPRDKRLIVRVPAICRPSPDREVRP